jgi:hypothetical protein
VHVAGADLHDEQAVQALQGQRAVDVEEIGGEHRRGLARRPVAKASLCVRRVS